MPTKERLRALTVRGRSVALADQIMGAVDANDGPSVAIYTKGQCPNCGGHMFNPGPQGGLAENVRCVGCGLKWHIAAPFAPHTLDNTDEAYDLTREFDMREYHRGEGEA